jgi:glycerate kinase
LGFGLRAFLRATLLSGFDFVSNAIGFPEKIKSCDAVVTGEGRFDSQSLAGKAPSKIARLARAHGKSTVLIAGSCACDATAAREFDHVFTLVNSHTELAAALREPARWLHLRAREAAIRLREPASALQSV